MGFYSLPTGTPLQKTKKNRLKNFSAGYVGSFCRNLADYLDNLLGSDFYANDYDIPSDDVQKYILATRDFFKEMQTDFSHCVTKDKINNASLRQKLIGKISRTISTASTTSKIK